MNLDVGEPHEKVQLANGNLAEARDALGLVMSPEKYAKKNCNTCYGGGIVVYHTPISAEVAAKAIAENPANEALLHQKEPGKFATRRMEKCGCVERQYWKTFTAFSDALVKEGLATQTGVSFDAYGKRWPIVQLV